MKIGQYIKKEQRADGRDQARELAALRKQEQEIRKAIEEARERKSALKGRKNKEEFRDAQSLIQEEIEQLEANLAETNELISELDRDEINPLNAGFFEQFTQFKLPSLRELFEKKLLKFDGEENHAVILDLKRYLENQNSKAYKQISKKINEIDTAKTFYWVSTTINQGLVKDEFTQDRISYSISCEEAMAIHHKITYKLNLTHDSVKLMEIEISAIGDIMKLNIYKGRKIEQSITFG